MLVFDKNGNIVEQKPEGGNVRYYKSATTQPPKQELDPLDSASDTLTKGSIDALSHGQYGTARKVVGSFSPKAAGLMDRAVDVAPYFNPMTAPLAIGSKLMGGSFGLGGGKDKDQQQRDSVRDSLLQGKVIDNNYLLSNPDGSTFDIGKDGGARLEDGRRYFDVNVDTQGNAIGAVNPLAYLITGGDEALATQFAGYFTNGITQGDGGKDGAIANANAKAQYVKSGFDTPEKAHAGIDELVKAGKLDPEKAAAFHGGINTVFGAGTPRTGSPNATRENSSSRRSSGKPNRRSAPAPYQPQTYTPQVYAPQTTAPMGTSSGYGNGFAESLANIYLANQGL